MEIKLINPDFRILNLGKDQITKILGWSNNTLQRYRHDIDMFSP